MKKNIFGTISSLQIILFSLFPLSFILPACKEHTIKNNDWNNPFPDYRNMVVLTKQFEKTFLLDSTTFLKYSPLQYDSVHNLLMAFNTSDRSLVFYDYDSCTLIKKTKFSERMSTGIGNILPFTYSFHFINFDSILLYCQTHADLFLVDTAGKVKKYYSLKPKDKSHWYPAVNPGEPLYTVNGKVYIPAFPGRNVYKGNDKLLENLVATVSINSGNTVFNMRYPALYKQGVWGEFLHYFFSTYNPYKKYWIYSFPIDHNIYVTDSSLRVIQKHYAGSEYVKHVEPLDYGSDLERKLDKDEEANTLIKQLTYGRIIYDNYAHVYYRLVSGSNKNQDIKTSKSGNKYHRPPFYIIILDENFQKVGEQDFDSEKYSSSFMFISKDGLCLPRCNINFDEKMVIDVFKLVNLN